MAKCYFVKVPKITTDGNENFLQWAQTHHYENCIEKPLTYETIGHFAMVESRKKQYKYTPAIFFEDEAGNIVEYYVAVNKNKLLHYTEESGNVAIIY